MASRNEIIEKLFSQILEWQRRNLSVSEQHLAGIITLINLYDSPKTFTELEQLLAVPQSYISHLVADLKDKSLVNVVINKTDKRQRFVEISDDGIEKVDQFDKRANEISLKLLSSLEKSEQKNFISLLSDILDEVGIVEQPLRKNDSILRPQQRRVAVLLGMTGRTVLGVPITSIRLHLLETIYKYNQILTANDLSRILVISEAGISQLIKQYIAEDKLFTSNPIDARRKYLGLTSIGEKYLLKVRQDIVSSFDRSLRSIPTPKLSLLSDLLFKFLGIRFDGYLIPKNEFPRIRKEIIEIAYKNGSLDYFPDTIASIKQNLVLKIMEADDAQSYLHFSIENKNASLDFITWSNGLALCRVWDYLQAAQQHLSKSGYRVIMRFALFNKLKLTSTFSSELNQK